jgi:uncharacterized protein (DUF2249 family)
MSAHVSNTPVTADERVSDVLARDEALVEIFVRHAPALAKLRNRTMRRVMARLVTVEGAAQMAGISAAALLQDLNDALGFARAPEEAAAPAEAPAPAADVPRTRPPQAPVVEVDVREELRAGREPFSQIMAAVGALKDGEVLRLRATFEPVPLFTVLAKRGFVHETTEHAADDWSIWFWRPGKDETAPAEAPAAPEPAAPAAPEHPELPDTIWLDVRGQQPPDPLIQTLAALETLPAGHTLIQINSRVPQFLLPVLAERGFTCTIDDSPADRVFVKIWRPA